jgi:hypothetical protein
MPTKWLARIAVAALMFNGLVTAGTSSAADSETIAASGTLRSQPLAGDIFSIGEFWMRVPANTEFNRWLSQGTNRTVVVTLTANPARFADAKNTRILSGTLMHGTAPKPTPAATDVIGRLPEGNLPFVHVLFLKDPLTGTLGPVTFETADFATAAKFEPYDDIHINIVIEIG